jgi:hypothetical protein
VLVTQNHLVRRAHDRKLVRGAAAFEIAEHLGLEDVIALLLDAVIHDDGYGGDPFLELVHPVGQCAEGRNDEVRAEVTFLFAQQCY